MNAFNVDLLQNRQVTVKFLLNERTIAFFPEDQQHRDFKAHGLSYEDNYQGNSLAGMVLSNRVEIRFHTRFSLERIRALWQVVLKVPALSEFASVLANLHYQGRAVQ